MPAHGQDLFCTPCGVKPNARGIEDPGDGTLKHKACGQPLDLAPTDAPVKLPPRVRPGGVLGRVVAAIEALGEDVVVHAERHDVGKSLGWKVEVYVPAQGGLQ